jgi:hypothetical protein
VSVVAVSQFAGAESSFLLPVSLYLFRIDKGAHADPLGRSVRLARQRAPIRAVPACLGPWPCLSPSRHLISAHGALPLLMAPCLCSWHLVSAHGTLSLLMAPCLCSWHLTCAHGTLPLLMAPYLTLSLLFAWAHPHTSRLSRVCRMARDPERAFSAKGGQRARLSHVLPSGSQAAPAPSIRSLFPPRS